jgi:hypothetical protein
VKRAFEAIIGRKERQVDRQRVNEGRHVNG